MQALLPSSSSVRRLDCETCRWCNSTYDSTVCM